MFNYLTNIEYPLSNKRHRLSYRSFRNFPFVIGTKSHSQQVFLTVPNGSSRRYAACLNPHPNESILHRRKAHLLQYVCFTSYHNNGKQKRDRNNHYLLASVSKNGNPNWSSWVSTIIRRKRCWYPIQLYL